MSSSTATNSHTTTNNSTAESSLVPPCRLLIRSKQQVELVTLAANDVATRRPLCKSPTSLLQVSPDGSTAYVHVVGKGICKLHMNDDDGDDNIAADSSSSTTAPPTPFLADTASVQLLALSPSGAYIITWERWQEDKPKNLKLWHAATAQLLAAFSQKSLSREAWPYLHWTRDEQLAFLQAGTGEIRVYPATAFFTNTADNTAPRYTEILKIPGMTSMSVPQHAPPPATTSSATTAPAAASAASPLITSYLLAAFCPKTKDKPARACLYQYIPGANGATCLASKSLFQAEEMQVHWSVAADAALITLQTSLDATGQSYYGNSQLFLMKKDSTVIAVPDCEEPIVDVAWMPSGSPSTFLVVSGRMPAMARQHHGQNAQAIYQYGHAHRNTISIAPHGRFFCLAGFGNLAGGMSFWDKNKKKLIPGCEANVNGTLRAEAATMHSWSPDSRMFMVATCSPRMNVDNGIRVFKYNGVEITDKMPWNKDTYRPDKLLQAMFVPAAPGVYPDRPQSPIKEREDNATPTSAATAAASSSTVGNKKVTAATTSAPQAPSATAGRYVPPSARNRPSNGTSLAERMRREKEGKLQSAGEVVKKPVGVVNANTGKVIPGLVVGSQPQQKTKSALKREKAKRKQEEEEAAKKLQQAVAVAQQQAAQATAAELAVDPEKRARKIKKVLKQIDELKSKPQNELNDEQKAKLASEASLREELEQLNIQG